MRLHVAAVCVTFVGLTAFAVRAQPSSMPESNYGDRQAGHFGDPGYGYFGNPADGNFGSQTLDQARARAANALQPANRRGNGPSPYVVLDQPPATLAPRPGSGRPSPTVTVPTRP